MENVIDLNKSFRDSDYKSDCEEEGKPDEICKSSQDEFKQQEKERKKITNFTPYITNNNMNINTNIVYDYNKSNTGKKEKGNKSKPSIFDSEDDINSGILPTYKKYNNNIINNNCYYLSGNTINLHPTSQLDAINFSKQSSGNLNIFDSEYTNTNINKANKTCYDNYDKNADINLITNQVKENNDWKKS